MSAGASKSTSKSSTVQLPFTEADLELLGINIDTAKVVFENLIQQQGFQQNLFKAAEGILGEGGIFNQELTAEQARSRIAQSQQSRQADQTRFGQNAQLQQQISDLVAGKGISEGDRANLDRIFDQAASSQLGALKRELAPSLGLRGSDSPIVDRGAVIASGLVGQRAQAEIGLGQSNLQNFGSLLGINNAANQFSQSLLQGDFNSQLGFLGQTAQSGLGLSSPTDIAALEAAARPQLGTESKSKTVSAQGSI